MDIKIAVLDGATLGQDMDLSVFDKLGETVVYPLTQRDEIETRIEDCHVCVVNKIKLDEKALSKAKNLKLICEAATGFDNIDTEYCRKKDIAVCNVAGYSVNSVSQVTLAMVLSASVNLPQYREAVANGSYSRGNVQNILTPVYHEIWGKTWGIIGYGNIGRRVASAAEALGCKVIANKRNPIDEVECVSLDELIRESDIITIHTPLTQETKGMIGAKEFSSMKDGVILVNVARGAVIDEEEAVKWIENGKIGFFGCDVYSVEPMAEAHPFYRIKDLENVCLTPHMAWGAFESRERCINEICENIKSFFAGESRNRIV